MKAAPDIFLQEILASVCVTSVLFLLLQVRRQKKGLLHDSPIGENSDHNGEIFWISGCLYSSRRRRRRGEGGGCREKERVIQVSGGANSAKRTVESKLQIGTHRREQTAGRQVESRRQVGSNDLLVTRAHVQTLIHAALAS